MVCQGRLFRAAPLASFTSYNTRHARFYFVSPNFFALLSRCTEHTPNSRARVDTHTRVELRARADHKRRPHRSDAGANATPVRENIAAARSPLHPDHSGSISPIGRYSRKKMNTFIFLRLEPNLLL